MDAIKSNTKKNDEEQESGVPVYLNATVGILVFVLIIVGLALLYWFRRRHDLQLQRVLQGRSALRKKKAIEERLNYVKEHIITKKLVSCDDGSGDGNLCIINSDSSNAAGDAENDLEEQQVKHLKKGFGGESKNSVAFQGEERALRRKKVYLSETECVICLVPFRNGDAVSLSRNDKCSHIYHLDCMLEWLSTNGNRYNCPTCRRSYLKTPHIEGEASIKVMTAEDEYTSSNSNRRIIRADTAGTSDLESPSSSDSSQNSTDDPSETTMSTSQTIYESEITSTITLEIQPLTNMESQAPYNQAMTT